MKILVVIDMQKDFIDGALGTPEAQAIVPNVKKKIEEFHNNGDGIVYTMDTHYKYNYFDTLEGKNLPIPHCIANSEGWFIPDELILDKNPRIIRKETFGSQYLPSNIWVEFMRKEMPESITVIGLCTDICVISNVMILKAHYPNIPIIVDSSCCAGTTPESHTRALEAMKMCDIDIINDDVEADCPFQETMWSVLGDMTRAQAEEAIKYFKEKYEI